MINNKKKNRDILGSFYINIPIKAQTIPNKTPTVTSFMKCTPPITLMTDSKIPNIIIITPYVTDINSPEVPITKAENTCLLGNDLPFVSLLSIGFISNISYGLFASNTFLNTLNNINGINVESISLVTS